MRRILVIGCGGAGKTAFALHLGEQLQLPVYHLDRFWWRPGWEQASPAHFDAELAKLLHTDSWIMDGNYRRTLPERLRFADTVIWLDYPRRICLWRLWKRYWRYRGTARPDMPPGCPERFDWDFFRYILRFPQDMRPRLEAVLANFPGRILRFKSPAEAQAALKQLPRKDAASF